MINLCSINYVLVPNFSHLNFNNGAESLFGLKENEVFCISAFKEPSSFASEELDPTEVYG